MGDKKFNIFQVAKIWKSEEIHTSVIAELINPQSAFHDKGAVFLDKFLLWIGRPLFSPEEREKLRNAKVETEVPTREGRRIDLVISTDSLYLPFEVKIWAGDQKEQLRDYYKFAQEEAGRRNLNVAGIYYLTPDGREPSRQSREGLSDDQICRLSFQGHILRWLEDCMGEPDIPSDVLEIMRQLYDNISGRPGNPARPSRPGFSRWKEEEDALDTIYQELSRDRELPWTECTNDYMTFTLYREAFENTSLEFALRIKKEGKNKVRLCLICGLTGEDGKPDYAAAGDYISEHGGHFETLLNHAFREGGFKDKVKSKTAWNRLPGESRCEDAGKCFDKIQNIFEELQPKPGQALKKEKQPN